VKAQCALCQTAPRLLFLCINIMKCTVYFCVAAVLTATTMS